MRMEPKTMATTIQSLTKAAVAAAATGAMLSAVPAAARDRHHDRDGISAGEVIAGAVILGGLAAILSDNDRGDYRGRDGYYDRGRYGYDHDRGSYDRHGYDRGNYGYDYRRHGNARQAVNQCVRDVEYRSGRWGRTDVTEIRDIERTRAGYVVKGRVIVRDGYRGSWGRSGYYDRGKFSCVVRYGRVEDVRFSGLG
jgi:hypothetical protein